MSTPVGFEGSGVPANAAEISAYVERLGLALPCQRPVRKVGLAEDGRTVNVLMRCGTRLRRQCPPCAALYRGDLRAVLFEGLRAAVDAGETLVLLTLTAPSFGRVHRVSKSELWRPGGSGSWTCPCGITHGPTDAVGGTPVEADRYDYLGQVRWNYHAGALWSRTADEVGRRTGLTRIDSRGEVRPSRPLYAGVAEWQARGAIHLHVVLRFPFGTELGVYSDRQGRPRAAVVEDAAHAVGAYTGPRRTGDRLAWGKQVRADVIRSERGAFRSAGYLAKVVGYAAKDVGADALGVEKSDGMGQIARTGHHARLRAAADLYGMRLRKDGAGAESVRRMSRAWGWRGNISRRARSWSELSLTVARARRAAFIAEQRGHSDGSESSIWWLPGAWTEPRDDWTELLAKGRQWRSGLAIRV